jgi:hypothetical protein
VTLIQERALVLSPRTEAMKMFSEERLPLLCSMNLIKNQTFIMMAIDSRMVMMWKESGSDGATGPVLSARMKPQSSIPFN